MPRATRQRRLASVTDRRNFEFFLGHHHDIFVRTHAMHPKLFTPIDFPEENYRKKGA
jgi:hypothetical protein